MALEGCLCQRCCNLLRLVEEGCAGIRGSSLIHARDSSNSLLIRLLRVVEGYTARW